MRGQTIFAKATFVGTLFFAFPAWGQPPARPVDAPPGDARLEDAKQLFREGVSLFEAGEVEAALDKFVRSRAAFPSSRNTINAALCLHKLQRFDEAIELYELTIAKFSSELDDQDRSDMATAMATLKSKVGVLDVSSNVEGTLVIDGRSRGKLPLAMPLRVVPGRHVLRVIKDGYASYEATFDIAATERKGIDARLTALQASGGLRIEDPDNSGADIVVDGAVVGQSPWEGAFAGGRHVVQSLSALRGSRPTQAIVVNGQTTLVRLKSEPLGPVIFISVTPSTAELALDGVHLGHGRWQGAVPVGAYRVSATEEGYFSDDRSIDVMPPTAGMKTQRISVTLRVDASHPRWPKQPDGHIWLRAMGGALVGAGLRGSAERGCSAPCSRGASVGFTLGARVGYELPLKLSAELMGGYLSATQDVTREIHQAFPKGAPTFSTTFALHDRLRLRGPMVGGGVSYRVGFGSRWSFIGRTSVGAIFGASTDTVTGTATAGQDVVDASIEGTGRSVTQAVLFVMPELGASYATGHWSIGAALAVLFVPPPGPPLPLGTLAPPPACEAAHPGGVGCTPASSAVTADRAFGAFSMFSPQISAGYFF